MKRATFAAAAALICVAGVASRLGAGGQLPETFFDERSTPVVAYATQPPHDPVAQLNEKLAAGAATVTFRAVDALAPALSVTRNVTA